MPRIRSVFGTRELQPLIVGAERFFSLTWMRPNVTASRRSRDTAWDTSARSWTAWVTRGESSTSG